MIGIIPLWLAVVGGSASLFSTGYIVGRHPDEPSPGVFAASFLGAWTAATYALLRFEGLLYEGTPDELVMGAFLTAIVVSVVWIPFMALLYEENTDEDSVEVTAR